MEQEFTDEEKNINNEAFVRNLSNIFAEAKEMLVEKAEEFGIDPFAVSDEEFREIQVRTDSFIKGQELTLLADKYTWDAKALLESKDEWLESSSIDEETLEEVLAVLYWYQFFIEAKIQRGFHGMLDIDGFEDLSEIRDPQSDGNGSIKIALIAIERSILAWTYLLGPENAGRVRPMIEILKRIERMTEEKFSRAKDFVRPGFDEIENVM